VSEAGEEEGEPEPRDMGWSPDGNGLTYLIQDPAPDSADSGLRLCCSVCCTDAAS
jgi:hypothetical protein